MTTEEILQEAAWKALKVGLILLLVAHVLFSWAPEGEAAECPKIEQEAEQ